MKTWCLCLLGGSLKGYICSGWSPFPLASEGRCLNQRGPWPGASRGSRCILAKYSLGAFLGHIHPAEHSSALGHQMPRPLTLISKHGNRHIFKSYFLHQMKWLPLSLYMSLQYFNRIWITYFNGYNIFFHWLSGDKCVGNIYKCCSMLVWYKSLKIPESVVLYILWNGKGMSFYFSWVHHKVIWQWYIQ